MPSSPITRFLGPPQADEPIRGTASEGVSPGIVSPKAHNSSAVKTISSCPGWAFLHGNT